MDILGITINSQILLKDDKTATLSDLRKSPQMGWQPVIDLQLQAKMAFGQFKPILQVFYGNEVVKTIVMDLEDGTTLEGAFDQLVADYKGYFSKMNTFVVGDNVTCYVNNTITSKKIIRVRPSTNTVCELLIPGTDEFIANTVICSNRPEVK